MWTYWNWSGHFLKVIPAESIAIHFMNATYKNQSFRLHCANMHSCLCRKLYLIAINRLRKVNLFLCHKILTTIIKTLSQTNTKCAAIQTESDWKPKITHTREKKKRSFAEKKKNKSEKNLTSFHRIHHQNCLWLRLAHEHML